MINIFMPNYMYFLELKNIFKTTSTDLLERILNVSLEQK